MVATPTRRRFHGGGQAAHPDIGRCVYRAGQPGALLRTEGLCASNLMTWCRQRTEGVLSALTPQKRAERHRTGIRCGPGMRPSARRTPGCSRGSNRPSSSLMYKKSHRSWAGRSILPRKEGAPDGRYAVASHRWLLSFAFSWSIPQREPLIQNSTDFSITSLLACWPLVIIGVHNVTAPDS